MKCVNCGTELPDGSNTCPNCGYVFSDNGPSQMGGQETVNNVHQGNNTGAANNVGNQPKKKHGCLIAFLIVAGGCFILMILLVACVALLGDSSDDKNNKATTTEVTTEETTEETTEVVTEAASEEVTTEEVTTEAEAAEEEFDPSAYRNDISYESISRKPDDYIGMKLSFSGRVTGVNEYDKETLLTIDSGYYYDVIGHYTDDTIMASVDPNLLEYRILEDDDVIIYGEYKGIEEFENALGTKYNYPYFVIDYIKLSNYDDTADSPTGDLKTGQYKGTSEDGDLIYNKTADVTYQDGESYGITIRVIREVADRGDATILGDYSGFLVESGDSEYTLTVDAGTITVKVYEDHISVSSSGDENAFEGVDGDYNYTAN